jgi:adenylyltransferase/sulfurtransferase
MEALKLILGMGTPYSGKLLFWDGADMSFHEIEVRKKLDCPVCSRQSYTEA